jgi:hypothetical protein
MKDAEILHIFVEIAAGRGNHGDFLKSFAAAVERADDSNFALIRPIAEILIEKYELKKYLDAFEATR